MIRITKEPTVADFKPIVRAIFYRYNMGHLAHRMDNVEYIINKLQSMQHRYIAKNYYFEELQWVLDYYRS